LWSVPEKRVLVRIPCGFKPYGAAFSPDGAVVYTTGGGGLGYYSTATGAPIAMLGGGGETTGIVVSPDGGEVYACDRSSGAVLVMSPSQGRILTEIPVADGPV